jgi:Sec-independent protein translocase protein TatA
LVVALIVIPPDNLPDAMRALGKILRELRVASNTVVRELSGALEEPEYMKQRPIEPASDPTDAAAESDSKSETHP